MADIFDGGGEVGALLAERDWTQHALGPPEAWPLSLRTIVRIMLTSRYAMWLGWGEELSFLYNDAYARMTLGAKHPWALARPARVVWSEIWEQVWPRIEHVLTTGEATWDEGLRLFLERHGYREETYHTFSYSPLPDDAGNIVGNFCVVTEETERVIGERRLATLRALAEGLAETNKQSGVFAAITGCIAARPHDLPFAMVYAFEGGRAQVMLRVGIDAGHPAAPDSASLSDGAPWPFARVHAGEGPLEVELDPGAALPSGPWDRPPSRALALPIVLQGQATPWGVLLVGLNPYRLLDEPYRSFLGLFTGQIAAGLGNARVYEEERRRAEALAALDRAKTAFFSNVSHEFRTPLTLMLGPTEDALTTDGALRGPELETVYRNELRLLKLVNSLLDFSRAEAGRTKARYEPVDLSALTADLASTFRSAIERGGLRFDIALPALSEPYFVDRQMWEKIVLNLLSNAFKFTFEGQIRVAVTEDARGAELEVEDTGVGIAPEELPRVFERFHRIEGARSRTHEGSGIGLALVHDLVDLHGGTIRVESEQGKGSRFRVFLPRGSAHLPQEHIGPPRQADNAGVTAKAFVSEAERWLDTPRDVHPDELAPAAPSDARAKIVVADDNADMRDYVKRLLGARWDVVPVKDGVEALAAVRRGVDLVVTDVMMPELDGFGLLAALREDERTRSIPVIMLSARAGEEMRLEGLQAGADDYLVKPFSARELLARVEIQLLRASMRAVEASQRRKLVEIVRQAPAAIAILRGPEHVFELTNDAYIELVAGRDVLGRPVRDALPELAGQGIYELLDGVYRSGQTHVGRAVRVMIARRDPSHPEETFFDFVYSPMRDDEGRVEGIACVAFDVSALTRARHDAESANRAKDEFLAMLGHELRNPLAPILTALQLMRLRAGNALEKERTVIERQVQHLVRLVDDLLDVSRIARGKIELRKERLRLAEVVARAIEMTSPLLEERRHRLTLDVPRALEVDADRERLAQIVANLLTNSAKYTESGGSISVSARREDGHVALRVKDSGVGIEPEMLPRVFDMFVQEKQSLERARGGLGLGLTIVKNLTTLHGGTVEARSAGRGAGTEMIVRLPPASTPSEAPEAAAPWPSPGAEPSARRPRVLVVDDNADAVEMLAEWVRSLGYEVEKALDGPSALAVASTHEPEIALLDLGLPLMDGFELADRLRNTPRHSSMKLVAITGYGQERDRERSRAAGFDAHLVKPVDLGKLQQLLSELLLTPP